MWQSLKAAITIAPHNHIPSIFYLYVSKYNNSTVIVFTHMKTMSIRIPNFIYIKIGLFKSVELCLYLNLWGFLLPSLFLWRLPKSTRNGNIYSTLSGFINSDFHTRLCFKSATVLLAGIHTHLAWISMIEWRKAEPQQIRLCTSMPISYSFNPIVSYSSTGSNSRMKLK